MNTSFILGLVALIGFVGAFPLANTNPAASTNMPIPEGNAKPENHVLNFLFNGAIVKVNLRGAPIQGENLEGRKDVVTGLVAKYGCTQEMPTISETFEERLEVNINYICDQDQAEKEATRVVYIILVVAVCIILSIFARMARSSSRVEGELRWRLWRVPRRHTLNSNAVSFAGEACSHDMNLLSGTPYPGANIAEKLPKTMSNPFLTTK